MKIGDKVRRINYANSKAVTVGSEGVDGIWAKVRWHNRSYPEESLKENLEVICGTSRFYDDFDVVENNPTIKDKTHLVNGVHPVKVRKSTSTNQAIIAINAGNEYFYSVKSLRGMAKLFTQLADALEKTKC